ncbi:MAG: hypothetical protein ACKO7R_01575 [Pseudanabaena sp.]
MSLKSNLFVSVGAFAVSLVASVSSALAEPSSWYFYVTNGSNSTMTRLTTAEQDKNWGDFDIGSGIAPGKTVQMVWDKSTNGQDCSQWIQATYDNGTKSTPVKIDFCRNLDDPIVFY